MERLSDIYQFFIADNLTSGWHQLYPVNQTIEWRYANDNDLKIWQKELTTKLIVRDNAALNVDDYTFMKEVEDMYTCEKREFLIKRKCGAGAFTDFFKGWWLANECIFNNDGCEITMQIKAKSVIDCLNKPEGEDIKTIGTGVEFSLFGMLHQGEGAENTTIATKEDFINHTASTNPTGTYVPGQYYRVVPDISAPDFGGTPFWTEDYRSYGGYGTPDRLYSHFIQIISDTAPPNPGDWTNIGGVWVRAPYFYELGTWVYDDSGARFIYFGKTLQQSLHNEYRGRAREVKPHGVLLNDVLEYFASELCDSMTVVSEFFRINETGVFPNNEPYSLIHGYLDDADFTLLHISDISHEFVDGMSSYLKVNPLVLLTDLMKLFNLVYWVEGTELHIEHISYAAENRRMDFTTTSMVKYIRGLNAYSYNKDEMPREEFFSYVGKNTKEVFDMTVKYPQDCADAAKQDIITEKLYADYAYAWKYKYEIAKEGDDLALIFITLTRPDGTMLEIENDRQYNSTLGFARLEKLHHYRRPFLSGEVHVSQNVYNRDFFSATPKKEQPQLTIPLCCEDVGRFEGDSYARTQLGWGAIYEATISEPTHTLTAKLRYA